MQKAQNNVLLTCRELTGFHGLEKSEEYSVIVYSVMILNLRNNDYQWMEQCSVMSKLDIQQIFSSDMLLIINFLNGLLFHV